MSYHLGLIIRPNSDNNKLYKNILLNPDSEINPPEQFIVPYTINNLHLLTIIKGSLYNRHIDGDGNQSDEHNLNHGELIENSDEKKEDPKIVKEKKKEKRNQLKKIFQAVLAFFNSLFSAEGELENKIEIKEVAKTTTDLPATYKIDGGELEISNTSTIVGNGNLEIKPVTSGLGIFLSKNGNGNINLTFKVTTDKDDIYTKTLKFHVTKLNNVEMYCLDFGSDALQVGRKGRKRINLYEQFKLFAQDSFKDIIDPFARAHLIFSSKSFFDSDSIYQHNEEEGLYNNLVFVANRLPNDNTDYENKIDKERFEKPELKDTVQLFNSEGLTPNHLEITNIKQLDSRIDTLLQQVEDLIGEEEEKIQLRAALKSIFFNTSKTLQKNLKLTFINDIVNNSYIPIYTTCISKIAWILENDMKANEKEFLDFTILYPNSFDQSTLIKMRKILQHAFSNFIDKTDSSIKGIELHLMSESDAAFLGIMKNNADDIKEDRPFCILIDIGKGTIDISLILKDGSKFYTIARKGSLKAGNFLTVHIFLDLLCYGYREHTKQEIVTFINSHLESFDFKAMTKDNMDIIKYVEKIKIRPRDYDSINSFESLIAKKDEIGTNTKLVDFLRVIDKKELSKDPNGYYYQEALKLIRKEVSVLINQILKDFEINIDEISVAYLSGRSFKDEILCEELKEELSIIGENQIDVEVFASKEQAVKIFNTYKGDLNFCNSIYKNVIFKKEDSISVASIEELISTGVECNGTVICLDTPMKGVLKISLVEDKFFKEGDNLISENNNSMSKNTQKNFNKDLSFAGFPFWTNYPADYGITLKDEALYNADRSNNVKKKNRAEEDSDEEEQIPGIDVDEMAQETLEKINKLDEDFLDEDL